MDTNKNLCRVQKVDIVYVSTVQLADVVDIVYVSTIQLADVVDIVYVSTVQLADVVDIVYVSTVQLAGSCIVQPQGRCCLKTTNKSFPNPIFFACNSFIITNIR